MIVPVYNAGDHLDRCAPSLVNQTMSRAEYEVIYVDDGSTDDSARRLAALARDHPHVRWVSQENSGWPGKPRNVGIGLSAAEYVQFVDQDDELARTALERLYEVAARNGSDVVLGKMGGAMAKPIEVFARNVESATLADIPAIDSLTGHKMFRRAFLHEHGIAFPEGYWRMEDLLFVVRAYVAQPRLSVVADEVCYWWHEREDGGNSSRAAFDLSDHYRRLRIIIDTLRSGVPPGEFQERLLRRLHQVETMSRVREKPVAADPDGPWRDVLPTVAAVARECFPPGVRDGLPAVRRLLAELVEREDAAALYEVSRRVVDLAPRIGCRSVRPGDDGATSVELSFSLDRPASPGAAGRKPLELVPGQDGEWLLDPEVTAEPGPVPSCPAGDPLLGARGRVWLRDDERQVWWYPDGELTPVLQTLPSGRAQVGLSGTLLLDAATAAAGRPLPPGTYTVWFVGQILGVNRRRRLTAPAASYDRGGWALPSRAPIAVRTRSDGPGAKLRLEVVDRQTWTARHLTRSLSLDGGGGLILACGARMGAEGVEVRVEVADRASSAALVPVAGERTARLILPPTGGLARGMHPFRLQGADAVLAWVRVTRFRRTWLLATRSQPPRTGLRRGPVGDLLRRLRSAVRRGRRRR